MNYSRISRVYIVPIAAYQAVAIAGGYGTGREVIEFFTSNGIFGGLYGLDIAIEAFLSIPPTQFDPDIIETIRQVTQNLDYPYRKMLSGAGHDAMNMAAVTPSGMIFVPCAGGISHNEAESALPEDLAAGANVLLHSLLKFSSAVA